MPSPKPSTKAAAQPTPAMRAAAEAIVGLLDSAFLRALTEASRLEVLRILLLTGTASIRELAAQLPQDRSVISRHLQVLETAGIVKSTWRGRDRLYTLDGQTCLATLEHIAASARTQIALCCPPSVGNDAPAPRKGSPKRNVR
ncbi:MAG TPA: helix-turn-helix transcriptional regulator [Kofleriaceae bacterium]|nr:helix-turn-helix transcriptional regulator [Kofleriaceae bacterium]